MYEVVSVGKLSETQKSKLRNGHPVRVKKGCILIKNNLTERYHFIAYSSWASLLKKLTSVKC